MIIAALLVKDERIPFYLENYIWVAILFTILFLILIKLFKVKFKSVLIFLAIIMFLLTFYLLNLNDFSFITGSTPENGIILSSMGFIAIYTTLPFKSLIFFLQAYDMINLAYIIIPIYMLLLVFLSYITLKFKVKTRKVNNNMN